MRNYSHLHSKVVYDVIETLNEHFRFGCLVARLVDLYMHVRMYVFLWGGKVKFVLAKQVLPRI